jgi:hypothetical protein
VQPTVRHREFWGADKRAALIKSLEYDGHFDTQYEQVSPTRENRYSFRPTASGAVYQAWPMVTAFCQEEPISGLQEMRRGALMHHDQAELQERMENYFNPQVDWVTFSAMNTGLSKDAGMFNPEQARAKLLKTESFQVSGLRRYALYPLDNRWCYYSAKPPLWNRPRPELMAQRPYGESFFIVRRFAERPREGKPAFLTSVLLIAPGIRKMWLGRYRSPVSLQERRSDAGE